MQSQFQKGWKGFNFSGFVKFRVFSCIARKAKVWEFSAPDDTDTTAIKVAIDDVILHHHVESFIIGQNYKAKILEEELNHLQIAISSPLNRILKYGISQAKDNSSVDVVGTFWSKLCLHNEKIGFCSVCNFHFAGQQGNCNRCSPSLCSREIPIEFLLFLKLEEKITSLREQGRDFYMLDLQFCIAVNYTVQLMWKMAMEVAMHFQVENYNSFCSLQDICAALLMRS